ncbi:hypothetical protein PAPYR_426 [Paratrimastix pyriformis]|uniref:Uncharacterized protein n=1 Tax=Paratrimastix pyriformis TaxID=342808 RepID=A0ABQ8UWA0_9EUKA|nr:hypothetical protein PAPYR_426 [Paratrimastix pyriformis]
MNPRPMEWSICEESDVDQGVIDGEGTTEGAAEGEGEDDAGGADGGDGDDWGEGAAPRQAAPGAADKQLGGIAGPGAAPVRPPPLPTLALLASLSQHQAGTGLEVLVGQACGGPLTRRAALWIYGLAACIEKPLNDTLCAAMRQLLLRCRALRGSLAPEGGPSHGGGPEEGEVAGGQETIRGGPGGAGLATLNLLIALSGTFFGQATPDERDGP